MDKTSEILQNLQTKSDNYARQTIVENKRLDDLRDALSHIGQQIEVFRKRSKDEAVDVMNSTRAGGGYNKADGVNVGREAEQATKKMLSSLEIKANKLLQRRSELINQIKAQKSTINHARRVRIQTDQAHKALEISLLAVKDKIDSIMRDSTEKLELRDKEMETREMLEKTNAEEQARFEEEYENMGKFIREQNDLLEQMLTHDRQTDILDDSQFQRSEYTAEQELAASQVGRLQSFAAAERVSLASIQSTISNYETMFEQLKRITNTESLEEIISTYAAHEEEMFSMYNYIQTQNTEIDAVRDNTSFIKEEIKAFKQRQREQEEERQRVRDALEQRLKVAEDSAEELRDHTKAQQESVDQIAKKVQSLFFKLQCDQMDSAKGGSNNKVGQKGGGAGAGASSSRAESKVAILGGQIATESNVLDFLGAIEQRAVDIISEYLRSQNRMEGHRSPTPGPGSPMKWPVELAVDLPELTDDELALEEEDSKPIDLGGFKEKLQKKVLSNSLQNQSKAF